MANLLTGDFEAVLQVSGDTLNRLLASMHQNAGTNPDNPSFPHSTGVRLGDVVMVGGVQGTAWAQVGVPRMTLWDHSTDRFSIEVDLRIRYVPDDGTEPLAQYIHGTLRAIYVLEDIDPTCPGWRKLAKDYLWVRVDPDSVEFVDVTAANDAWWSVFPPDVATVTAGVTEQLRTLLEYSFEPSPHPVQGGFRRGSFLSLNQGFGEIDEVPILSGEIPPIAIGGAAVSVPVGITEAPNLGAIGSIGNVVLGQRDFALAVNVDAIMGQVNSALDTIRGYTQTFNVSGDFGSTVYRAFVSSATAVWVPHGSFAEISVTVEGGANTDSILPNIGFTVTQRFQVGFDAGAGALTFWASGNNVRATASGVGLPSSVLHDIAATIGSTVESQAEAAASAVQPSLQQFTGGTADLVKQLRSLDAAADAALDDATFHASGVVLRGWISVARRHRPVVTFRKVDDDTFSALDSWIPGGRIDRISWTWTWSTNWLGNPADDGSVGYEDRYALTRQPSYGNRGRFGVNLTAPMPGLDGPGRVCLTIEGVAVDTTTGQLVPVSSRTTCTRFGYLDRFRPDNGRLYVREWEHAHPHHADPAPHPDPGPELLHLDVTASSRPAPGSPNTLLVHVPSREVDAFGATLRDGLAECRRQDAALLVLALLPDGTRGQAGGDLDEALRRVADGLEAAMVVNEDVDGAWSRAFAIPPANGAPSWRLLSPDGGVMWMEDGPVTALELAEKLDNLLTPSVDNGPAPLDLDLGAHLGSPDWLGHIFDHPPEVTRPNCPPVRGLRGIDVTRAFAGIAFVRHGEAASDQRIRALRDAHRERTENDPAMVLVLDGATDDDAATLDAALGPAFTVVADPDGSKAKAVGVRTWPSTVMFDGAPATTERVELT